MAAAKPTPQAASGRVGRALVVVAVGVLALALAERGLRLAYVRWGAPTGAAEWIWIPGPTVPDGPVAFYLARDFDLGSRSGEARLLCLGDEEYVAFLNGNRVGSNRYRLGAPLDAYEVGHLLVAGKNRLVVELRSRRGAGGFIASLAGREDGEPLVVTDARWRSFPEHRPDLLGETLPAAAGGPVRVWGRPPTGLWGLLREGPTLPVLSGFRPPVEAARFWRDGEGWRPSHPPGQGQRLGSVVVFDWGREMAGYLSVRYRGTQPASALVYADLELASLFRRSAEAHLIGLAGRRSWQAAEPRRFRYVAVLGLERVVGAAVYPVDGAEAAALFPRPRRRQGVFGLVPPPLRSSAENEIWRKLEGLPGAVGR